MSILFDYLTRVNKKPRRSLAGALKIVKIRLITEPWQLPGQ